MNAAHVILVGGGARSGKSRFALARALESGQKRAFVATATAFDDEMTERIQRHRDERQSTFHTIEAPTALSHAASRLENYDVILLDCLTLYVSNLLLAKPGPERWSTDTRREFERECWSDVQSGVLALQSRCTTLVVVTNEVGQGVVPSTPMGRLFRDVAGRVNQSVAAMATEVWLCAFGLPLRLKPSLSGQNPIG